MAECVGGWDVSDRVHVCVSGAGDWGLWELCGKFLGVLEEMVCGDLLTRE